MYVVSILHMLYLLYEDISEIFVVGILFDNVQNEHLIIIIPFTNEKRLKFGMKKKIMVCTIDFEHVRWIYTFTDQYLHYYFCCFSTIQ